MERTGPAMKAISLKKEDESALTRRSMAEIATAKDAEWQSNRPAGQPGQTHEAVRRTIRDDIDLSEFPRAKPEFVEPMQAKVAVEKRPPVPIPGSMSDLAMMRHSGVAP
jgi:hypothetical protein